MKRLRLAASLAALTALSVSLNFVLNGESQAKDLLKTEKRHLTNHCTKASNECDINEEDTENSAQTIQYPFLIDKSAILNLATGEAYPLRLSAMESKSKIKLEYTREEESIPLTRVIEGKNIISWSVGDYTEQKFSFANAAAGTIGFAAGAIIGGLIIPNPISPLLFLMSPFAGGIAGAASVDPQWRVAIQTLDALGREETVLIQFFKESDVKQFATVIEDKTSLSAGVKRSLAEIKELRIKQLKTMIEKRNNLALSLSKTNSRKPWCTTIDLSGKLGDPAELLAISTRIDSLVADLSLESSVEEITLSSEDKWASHLEKNPNLKIWAEANKEAASKLKKCPKTQLVSH